MSKSNERKEWAKELYLTGHFNQKQIAEKVGCTEKTISKWIRAEEWEDLKANFLITKPQILKQTYAQINAIHEVIQGREKGAQFATTGEADILSKLSASIKNLEQDLSISQVIDVFVEFTNWLKKVDVDSAKAFIQLQDGYIKTKLAGK